MYKYFSRAVTKRIIEALRISFDSNPKHRGVTKNIQEKSEFSERPQRGIVVQTSSVSPQPLSSDNYMGVLHSHVMLAQLEGKAGTCVEWVRENDHAIQLAGGFPTDAGVYYVQIEAIPSSVDVPTFQFYVDPLLTVLEEPLITFTTGNEATAVLDYAPVLDGSVDLYSPTYGRLLRGQAFEVGAAQSLYIGSNPFGLKVGRVPVTLKSTDGPFGIFLGTNDALDFLVNGDLVSLMLTPGAAVTATALALEIQAAITYNDVSAIAEVDGDAVRITSTYSLEISSDVISTINSTLGFSEGFVPVTYQGTLTQGYIPPNTTLVFTVDGVDFEAPLERGQLDLQEIANLITTQIPPLTVTLADAGDYSLNATSGVITMLHPFLAGTEVIADYRYPQPSIGPFPIGTGEVANITAIPGVLLAFGDQLVDQDAVAVVVSSTRSDVAKVYGGKASVSMDVDVIARDPMTRNEMADLALMYLWQTQKETLAEEGIAISDVSIGNMGEDSYDDNADDFFYTATLSLSMLTDWEVYEARPLFIRRVTPYTYAQDGQRLLSENGVLLDSPEGISAATSFPRVYVLPSFERIR